LDFTDPLECEAAVLGSDVKILPMEKGNFHAEITQIGMNKIWMQHFKLSLPHLSSSSVNVDRKYIGFLMDTSRSGSMHHCGMEVARNDIVVGGLDHLHQRLEADCHYGTVSLSTAEWSGLCKAIVGREFLDKPQISVTRPNPELLSRLRQLHSAT